MGFIDEPPGILRYDEVWVAPTGGSGQPSTLLCNDLT